MMEMMELMELANECMCGEMNWGGGSLMIG